MDRHFKIGWLCDSYHISTVHKFIDWFLFRNNKTGSSPLHSFQNIAYNVQHFIGWSKMIRAVDIVDVMNCLLQMVCSILYLLEFPWWIGINSRSLNHIWCFSNFKTYFLKNCWSIEIDYLYCGNLVIIDTYCLWNVITG